MDQVAAVDKSNKHGFRLRLSFSCPFCISHLIRYPMWYLSAPSSCTCRTRFQRKVRLQLRRVILSVLEIPHEHQENSHAMELRCRCIEPAQRKRNSDRPEDDTFRTHRVVVVYSTLGRWQGLAKSAGRCVRRRPISRDYFLLEFDENMFESD
jgi:hypothetical protein